MTTGKELSGELFDDARGDEGARPQPARVYIGLGSNLGDREANLREAVERIESLGLEVVRASSIYETEPVGYAEQPWFLNQVIEARIAPGLTFNADEETALEFRIVAGDPAGAFRLRAGEMLRALHGIEDEMGRERTMLNGPRVIDIDILFFPGMGGFIARTEPAPGDAANREVARAEPVIPHPRMHERRFVLQPLCEIAPDLTYPGLDKTFCEMLAALDDPSTVRIYKRGGQAGRC